MTNFFDYLIWRGDLLFSNAPFGEVDGAVLSRLSYLPFERLTKPSDNAGAPRRLGAAVTELLSLPDLADTIGQKEDLRLLRVLADSPRFASLSLFRPVSRLDAATQTQFSALTVCTDDGTICVAFRGTDNTLVGWKEDFNMGFVRPVPAQTLSVQYLTEMAGLLNGPLITAGHSKGGNLSVYAAAFCPPAVQTRLTAIYNYDGPGFDDDVLSSPGYRTVRDRIHTFVPQSSVVGMLFRHEEAFTTVHSERTGLFQHDLYSWEIRCNRFVYLSGVNRSSRFVDGTLKAFISDMDYRQREQFVEAVFTVLTQTHAETFRDLSDNWLASAKSVLHSLKDLDEPTRKAVSKALWLLVKSTRDGWDYAAGHPESSEKSLPSAP